MFQFHSSFSLWFFFHVLHFSCIVMRYNWYSKQRQNTIRHLHWVQLFAVQKINQFSFTKTTETRTSSYYIYSFASKNIFSVFIFEKSMKFFWFKKQDLLNIRSEWILWFDRVKDHDFDQYWIEAIYFSDGRYFHCEHISSVTVLL